MLKKGLVSVIIPTYNRASVIIESVNSVLRQTYDNYEIIIIDDGSTDNTRQIIQRLANPKIRYYWQENTGLPAAARNAGIKAAQGEYLAFLDSDDIWLPQKIEKQTWFLEKHQDVFLVYSQCSIHQDNKPLTVSPLQLKNGYIFNELYLSYNFISLSTVMMRNSCSGEKFYFDEDKQLRAAEDYDLWLRISHNNKIDFIQEPLAIYVRHSVNISPDATEPFDKWKIIMLKHSRFAPKSIRIKKYLSYYKKLFFAFLRDKIVRPCR